MGLPQLVVNYDRKKIAQYGGTSRTELIAHRRCRREASGVVFENERRFDLVLRLDKETKGADGHRPLVCTYSPTAYR